MEIEILVIPHQSPARLQNHKWLAALLPLVNSQLADNPVVAGEDGLGILLLTQLDPTR
ncbi:hypothetical protein C2W64_02756 [Brevibacillus laterosporus]|nr:hypothetical protein C2W64_02756 [Brevibacillus laterosporus]